MKVLKKDIFMMMIIVISILTAVTIFLPSLAFSSSDSAFSGIEIVFGTEFVNLGSWASGNVNLSILGILAYLLPLGALVSVVSVKNGYALSILLFTINVILLFLLPEYTKTTVTVLGQVSEIEINWVVSYGLIIAQILSVLGIIVSTIKVVKFQKFK